MKEKKLGPIQRLKMWLLLHNVSNIQRKTLEDKATEQDLASYDRMVHAYKVMLQRR